MPYSHPKWRTYGPTFGGTWHSFWDFVVRMQGLRDLEVYLEYEIDFIGVEDELSSARGSRGYAETVAEHWGAREV